MSIPLVKRQNELYHESHYMVDNQLVIFDIKNISRGCVVRC